MNRILWPLLCLCLIAFAAVVQASSLKKNHPDHYVVQKGDTLWGIAEQFFSKGWQWQEIWADNPQISNPHLIYPGDIVALVATKNGPALKITRAKSTRVVKLSPKVRTVPHREAAWTIPIDILKPFLNGAQVVSEKDLTSAPYVIATEDEKLMSAVQDRIFVRDLNKTNDRTFNVFEKGDAYYDPDSHELLGYEAVDKGDAQLLATGDPATLVVTRTAQPVLVGDRLLKIKEQLLDDVRPHTPYARDINARIIAVHDGVSQIGQYSVVTISGGDDKGLIVGDLLTVYRTGEMAHDKEAKEDVQLPDTYAGDLLVFRIFDKVSFGLILKARRAMHLLDKVKSS